MVREMFEYRIATQADLEQIWNMNIADNADDARWVRWKEEYIAYNEQGMAVTFVVVADGRPVGEGTLLLSPFCKAVSWTSQLADGVTVANVNALRIRKEYEGQGHISRLMGMMEEYAAAHGIHRLTIGVEARETQNLAIYLHWGYDAFRLSEIDEGELVLYYEKEI